MLFLGKAESCASLAGAGTDFKTPNVPISEFVSIVRGWLGRPGRPVCLSPVNYHP